MADPAVAPDSAVVPSSAVVHVSAAPGEDGDAGIRILQLNRPDRLNAMNNELIDELHQAIASLRNDAAARVVILTGSGRGFCAGLDLMDPPQQADAKERGRVRSSMDTQQRIAALVPALANLQIPVIAAVNGAASGGGLALALASDIRIAGASAKFNVAFVRVGLSGCDIGVSWLLPRLIGASAAFELLLTGRLVGAEEADRIGLVSRTVPDEHLMESALETARLICGNSPTGMWMTKEVMWAQLEVGSLEAGIDLENRTQIMCTFTSDLGEAVAAFAEKRPPRFTGK